jgi:transposase
MFGIGPATRIYLAAGATDMRKNFEGLHGLVRDRLACDPLSGHVFLFSNAQRNRLKLLFWDGSGLWVCAKRPEKGRFRWPDAAGEECKMLLSYEELMLLLGGIDLTQTGRRAWHRVTRAPEEKDHLKRQQKCGEMFPFPEPIRYPRSKPYGEFNALHGNPHGS